MRNLRIVYMCGALSLASIFVGCNAPAQGNCPKPLGVYKAQYSLINGNCTGGYQPFALKFEADDPPSTTKTETRLADVVITETLVKGCELQVGQRVTGEGATNGNGSTRSAIAATLGVVDDMNLSGTVVRTDFMADGETVRCSASYDAWYSRDDLLLGAAARD